MQPGAPPPSRLTVRLHPDVAEALETTWEEILREIRERLGAVPRLEPDPEIHLERFELIDGDQAPTAS